MIGPETASWVIPDCFAARRRWIDQRHAGAHGPSCCCVIAVGAIMGVVVALSSGQPTVAMIIGLVAAAFFARVGC